MNSLQNMTKQARQMMLAGLLMAGTVMQAANTPVMPRTSLEKAVRHELVMLPFYNIFDNLTYRVEGNKVVLSGQVTRPTLRSDAERVVRKLEGVEHVENKIEVLPLSPFDDRARRAVARAIYGFGPLQRYGLGSQPPIHIIVRNGQVTLEGVVANEMDRNMANIRANQVPDVFSVTNNLAVEK